MLTITPEFVYKNALIYHTEILQLAIALDTAQLYGMPIQSQIYVCKSVLLLISPITQHGDVY